MADETADSEEQAAPAPDPAAPVEADTAAEPAPDEVQTTSHSAQEHQTTDREPSD